MRLVKNQGNDRVLDALEAALGKGSKVDIATSAFSAFGFAECRKLLDPVQSCRLVLPKRPLEELGFLGTQADRAARNRLQIRWLAREVTTWIQSKVELKRSPTPLMQSMWVAEGAGGGHGTVITGQCPLTTQGLGLTPPDDISLIQLTEGGREYETFSAWFSQVWSSLPVSESAKKELLQELRAYIDHRAPSLVYHMMLFHLFKDLDGELDEERIMKSATGIRDTIVWKKLYRFQRDGVIGAVDKLNRFGGCIIADSVGLGKTFEALAVIKYHELRNDRVLVLCPKRLRDNWTLYKSNDIRNSLASDRFHYDVLSHTDLSREKGTSGDIDLSFINWGNYDLLVIDESHNFRNKASHRERESRYQKLMRRVIKSGVKTRVLMLSATPVNNRLADLKNQIAFVTEGEDDHLASQNIPSIEKTLRTAQIQFNRWQGLEDQERTSAVLLDMLGFDYFRLLDALTIARSRKHIEKYYGLTETGRFPDRLPPINIKADVDLAGQFPPIGEINNEIRRLTLAAYAPLSYLLPNKVKEYDQKYSTAIRGGESIFRQADREESLVQLMRVNLLKRMESSVVAFALTLERQLKDVDRLLHRIDNHDESIEEISLDDIDFDDPAIEALVVGNKVKVLLQDVDLIRWRQDLALDRNRLDTLLAAARQITPDRDAKLKALKDTIAAKLAAPINSGNRKTLLFSASADTVDYLYQQLAPWALRQHGIHTAQVTGTGAIKTTLPKLHTGLVNVLTAFSPRAKERPESLKDEGEIDLLIGTDCISEGQNLQDCDYLINYDIHWNPVRIIQRFGRIDRLGSPNTSIQLVNFWPNMELEEYINLEQRVSGKMVLLDISATGEENLIEYQSGDQMNDLEYRRKQLLKLQDSVIDMEDISAGLSITDLTLNDFRVDLTGFLASHPDALERLHLGSFTVTTNAGHAAEDMPPGVIFLLRSEKEAAGQQSAHPLAPHYMVHVGDDGAVVLPYTATKKILDRLKRATMGRDLPNADACARFDKQTRHGEDTRKLQDQLAEAIRSIVGKTEERAVASLFNPEGTHALQGEFHGSDDFEVVAYVVILPERP
mgnify:CR=1 FL=1